MQEFTGVRSIDVLFADAGETPNGRGNLTRSIFYSAERYLFNLELDFGEGAWDQFDTASDASYFGVWVNKTTRQVLQYAEGDILFTQCVTTESFDSEIEALCSFHGTKPAVITIEDDGRTEYYQDRSEFFIDPARGAAFRFKGDDAGGD